MKKLAALITGLVLLAILDLSAQDLFETDPYSRSRKSRSDKESGYKHNLGLAAGFTTGYGLSYRYWPRKLGAQVTFAPFNTNRISQYSVGLTFLYKLAETYTADLFIYESTHFFYRQEFYVDDFSSMFYDESVPPVKRQVNCGFGAGVEFKISDRITFDLMIGYAGYNGFKKVNLTGETGIYFRF